MRNQTHQQAIDIFNNLAYLPPIPLTQIKHEEVLHEWKNMLPNKSSDSTGTSAFILKKLPIEYVTTITVLFNKCASNVENLRLPIAACNKPALTIFVDFLSAFDRIWYPALIKNLEGLDMPLALLKWIQSWLQNRYLYISYGEANSKTIKMNVGAPQSSVLAATLFKLHVHFLLSFLAEFNTHLFADDLAIVISGSLEKRFSFSLNIDEIEEHAKVVMKKLEKFAQDTLLAINVNKTKALLVHSVVSPRYPTIKYNNQNIEYTSKLSNT
ncbi:unnamed protein product [Rotaria socialis]|uniref:Reverse transcriptase domain-containing protein n=1 Tax=Rotaria socialis TaxID=392032 RepID=A0A820RKP2_9BILA|nr:unnamed protein product [Rotaria socialis]